MAVEIRVVRLLVAIYIAISPCLGTTHWVVTEDGMITQQLDSVFNLREPYNLIAIMGQEKRSLEVSHLEESLRLQKVSIEANEDKDTDLEQRFLETDPDCVAAGRPLSEFELYISTALSLEQKGINPLDHMKMKIGEVKKFRQPNCTRALELQYSIHAFDHIKAIQERHNISSFPEPELMYLLPSVGSLENAGHMIYKAMSKNKTSWVLFNLAAYYWRVKGRPEQVIECSRRALHHSPQEHKNVALMNMANVLHRGHLSADASILADAALNGDQEIDIVYFTLGNIYAAIGEYNRSSWCFGHTARINPALGAAEKRQHAVKCHQKLERALEAQHSSLQRTLAELKDYQTKQEYFLEIQKKMWSIQRKAEDQYEANLSYQKHRFLQEMGENPRCEVSQLGSGTQFLMCRRDGIPESDVYGLPFDEEKEIEVVDESRFQNNCVIFPKGEKNCLNLSSEGVLGPMEYSAPQEAVTIMPPARKMDHPTKSQCERWRGYNVSWKEYAQKMLPVAMNDSFKAMKDNIELPDLLPTGPLPACSSAIPLDGTTGVDFIEGVANRANLPNVGCPIELMRVYRHYLNAHDLPGLEMDYRVKAVIGSIEERKDPWLIYSAISVHLRMHEDNIKAIDCLRRALVYSPPDYVKVPLTNLALIMNDQDHLRDAIQLLRMALVLDSLDPSTRYLLGCLYGELGKYNQAKQELSMTLTLDPEFPFAEEVLRKMRCRLKETRGEDRPEMPELPDGLSSEARAALRKIQSDRIQLQNKGTEAGPRATNTPAQKQGDGGGAVPTCVQGPPLLGDPSLKYSPAGMTKDNGNNVNTFKTCNAGTVPSTAFGPQIPAAPAPDVDVHKLLGRKDVNWPTVEQCAGFRKLNLKAFYSTWVSVSAKDMKLEEHIDFVTPLTREELKIQPYCDPDQPTSMHTLDHLHAMAERRDLEYEAEQGLKEVIQTINGAYMNVDEVGTRIAKLLRKEPESWVATNMAALYWRIEGKSENALDCLRHALHYAPSNMKDLAMVSIANIFHRVGMYDDAATIAKMAIDISPRLVINHFTLANIYSSKGQWDHALEYYDSTLKLQPDFQPAVERLRTIQCNILQLTGNKNPS